MEEVNLSAGDLNAGFAQADEIFESRYQVPAICHAINSSHRMVPGEGEISFG